MSGLQDRIDAWASGVIAAHPDTPSDVEARALIGLLLIGPIARMLDSISDPTTWEWTWHLGGHAVAYREVTEQIDLLRQELIAIGDVSRAEVGGSLLDELGAGYALAEEQVQIAADAAADAADPEGAAGWVMTIAKLAVAYQLIRLVRELNPR
jgi:hypothetical protein